MKHLNRVYSIQEIVGFSYQIVLHCPKDSFDFFNSPPNNSMKFHYLSPILSNQRHFTIHELKTSIMNNVNPANSAPNGIEAVKYHKDRVPAVQSLPGVYNQTKVDKQS